jgi:hypothetical protein
MSRHGVVGTDGGIHLGLYVRNMSPLMGLKILSGSVSYKDVTPTALGERAPNPSSRLRAQYVAPDGAVNFIGFGFLQ